MTVLQDISKAELIKTVKKISTRKALSLDVIFGLDIKAGTLNAPDFFGRIFNIRLKELCFPAQWNVQKLALIPSENKSQEEPSSYRPTNRQCLLHNINNKGAAIVTFVFL